MVQWIGVGFAVLGMAYNTYQSNFARVQPAGYYQAVFDPVNNKVYVLYPDGRWYEQIPVRADQTQYPANLAVGQGSQSAQVGQRNPQQSAQTAPNPWLR